MKTLQASIRTSSPFSWCSIVFIAGDYQYLSSFGMLLIQLT
jgi:hypothetical protein